MSKLEKLIQQYCPDGVEYVSLSSIADLSRGKVISKDYIKDNGGDYPVYSSQSENEGILGRINSYMYDGKYLTWTTDGAYAGTIFRRLGKFNITNVCGLVKVNTPNVSMDFLYYWLYVEAPKYVYRGMGNPKLMSNVMGAISVPVPPLPVQEEIVRVLDAFTELQAELQKRLQQYNYYRDNLLTNFTPEQASKEYTLGEVTVDIYSGATPSKEKREYWVNGTIPWMSSGEVNLGQVYEVEGRITQLGYDKCSTKMVPEGSVVIALAGQGKTRGTVAILRTSVCTNQSLAALVPQKEIVSGEYLYYYLKTQYAKLREVSAGDGTRGGLNLKMLKAYKVVIPSHKAQDQIVAILDRFDTLTNDLTSGLPAEIEKRRQQYEFYRDKLLTFKRKEA